MLIYRLHEAVVLRLSQEVERGLTVSCEGWQMNRIGLSVGRPPADTLLPLPDITAVEQFDGKLCVWRRGQDEAAAKLDPGDEGIEKRLERARKLREKQVEQASSLDDGSTAVYVVTRTRVADSTTNPTLVQQQNAQLQQRSAQGEVAAYVNEARRKAKIVKNLSVFE